MPLPLPRPFTLGHEIEGEVIAMGPDVPRGKFERGKSYAVYPWIGCEDRKRCVQCRTDRTNHLCRSPKSKGFTDGKTIYGGYASHCLVPDYRYLIDYEGAVPRGLGGVYMCSGLTAFSALKKVLRHHEGIINASDVMILGLGGLGFQGLCFAEAMLGGMPCVADIDEEKLTEARKRGCRTYNTKSKDAAKRVKADSFDGTGIGAVIDFVGASATHNFAEQVLRKGGLSVVVGLFGGMVQKSLVMTPLQARTVVGAFVGSFEDAHEMMDVLRKNNIPPPPHHFRSISEASKSLYDLREGRIMGRCIFRHDWPESNV